MILGNRGYSGFGLQCTVSDPDSQGIAMRSTRRSEENKLEAAFLLWARFPANLECAHLKPASLGLALLRYHFQSIDRADKGGQVGVPLTGPVSPVQRKPAIQPTFPLP